MEASNVKAMREALSSILGIADHLQTRFAIPKLASEEISELKQIVESAIKATPRNGDAGTAEEQYKRFLKFCHGANCSKCPVHDAISCQLAWSQMPYEEGGAE